ncbi:MAG: hypothetical protein IJ048_14540 [Clostridia bacterium]|nr:hypothetical protein [Clostridia bacterium]
MERPKRGRKARLTPQDLEAIRCLIHAQPEITIGEIRERLHLAASRETVRKAVVRMGFRHQTMLVEDGEGRRRTRLFDFFDRYY